MEPQHIIAGLLTMAPIPSSSGTPLGKYGPLVATIIAVGIVGAAIAIHVAAMFVPGAAATDPFIDSAALLVIGVVLGASALGGQASQAHEAAVAANRRLDALGAPSVHDGAPQ